MDGHSSWGLEVLHLDMDCFFASVEVLDDPALSGCAVIVGGVGERGVVCSASYEARAYGVHSAMPTVEARRLCPQAVYLPPRHGRYGEVSEAIRAVLVDVTPLVEPLGLDEAFLDVSGAHRLHGDSVSIAAALRRRIAGELGLACSVGVARTKLVAKLASKAAKPKVHRLASELPGRSPARPERRAPSRRDVVERSKDAASGADGEPSGTSELLEGVVVVRADEELSFLHGHPVRALPGVGPQTASRLARFGVATVGDLAAVPPETLRRAFGSAHGSALHALAHGRDERGVEAERAMRSVGHEETFRRDLHDRDELARRAREMAVSVASRLRRAGAHARTLSIKLRYADFSTRTRSRTLAAASDDAALLADVAVALLAEAPLAGGIRLLGVHASGLVEGPPAHHQLGLFDAAASSRAVAEEAAAIVRARFGPGAITSAAALSEARGVRDDGGALGAAGSPGGWS